MRVAKTGTRREGAVAGSKGKKRSPHVERAFSDMLQLEQVEHFDLVQALKDIDEHSRRLKESPILENLLRYKKKLSAILRLLVGQSSEVAENSYYDMVGRRRFLLAVQTIDHKLEELTKDFLHKQMSGLELVSRLDEIRGLLLDLYS